MSCYQQLLPKFGRGCGDRGTAFLHKTWRAVSATLGGSDTKSEATSFASTLFGSSFVSDSMILGTRSAIKSKRMFLHWPELVLKKGKVH